MSPFPLFVAVAAYFGVSVFTGDTLASSVAALLAGIAAWINYRTHRNTEASAPHEPDTLYDMIKKLLDEGGSYQHQRNHDILNALSKVFALQVLMAHAHGVHLPADLIDNPESPT